MIPYNPNPKPIRVGYWHYQSAKWEDGRLVAPRVKEVRFDNDKCYEGLLHGFGTEGDFGEGGEFAIVALVEKADGTFDTPTVNVIQLIK